MIYRSALALPLVFAAKLAAQDVFEPLPDEEASGALEPLVVTAEPEQGVLDPLVVTASSGAEATGLAALSMQSVRVVQEETLRRNAQATLGETLAWEPGVSSGYFGPGASRPVVRGFEGVRVRMLRDDLGTFDLSDISPDHGVALEPFLLESVEIHRGPASLLYGNSAIGGAVNARTRVIARELPERAVAGGVESRYETQGDGLGGAGHLSLVAGPVVFRFTGSTRDAGDISIPGRARSDDYQRLENPRVYDPALGVEVPVPNPRGTLPNSGHESSTWSAGVSWLPKDQPLTLGAAYSRFDSRYGVPYFYPGDATDLFGDYTLDLVQDRFDFEGSRDFAGGFVTKIDGRLGYGAYRHRELFEGRGKDAGRDFTDTYLEKDAAEGRLDIHHEAFDGRLSGIFGITAGKEALTADRTVLPPPDPMVVRNTFDSENLGAYFLERWESGDWTAQLGHRIERLRIVDDSLEEFDFVRGETGVSHSTSAALTWRRQAIGPLDELALTGIASRIERLPTAVERYAFWNNAGIGRFLIGGDLDGKPLSTEESLGFEFGAEASKGPATLRLNVYRYDFDNFIFLQEAVAQTGGFGRAAEYIERAAEITGFEAELEWQLDERFTLTLMSDCVHAENTTDDEPIPRMPPLRFGGRLEWRGDRVTAGVELRHATAQDRTKPAPRPELESDAYTLLNADVSWEVPLRDHEVTVFLRATNLLDEVARVSTSFRKDVAPLPGRGAAIGLRYEF